VPEKNCGATTTDLRVAVTAVGFKSKKSISRAMAIARGKYEKEGIMPAGTKTKVKKAKKGERRDEIAKLRTDITALRKQMKALDSSLKKEQSVAKSAKRSVLLEKLKAKTWELTKKMAGVVAYPVVHPIVSAKTVVHGAKISTFWVGSMIKKPFSWLARKTEEAEAAAIAKPAEA